MKSIVGLEALVQLTPSQANTLARYKAEIARIAGILTESGEPLDL